MPFNITQLHAFSRRKNGFSMWPMRLKALGVVDGHHSGNELSVRFAKW